MAFVVLNCLYILKKTHPITLLNHAYKKYHYNYNI